MSMETASLPRLPPGYRRTTLLGGLMFIIFPTLLAAFALSDLLSERVPHALKDFELAWNAERAELQLQGRLLDRMETVELVLDRSLPERFYTEANPMIFQVSGSERWELDPPGPWFLPLVLAFWAVFVFLGVWSIDYWRRPRRVLRHIEKHGQLKRGRLITQIAGSSKNGRAVENTLVFQAEINGVIWRYESRSEVWRSFVDGNGRRDPKPGDEFGFFCCLDDPRIFLLPQALRALP